MEIKKILLVLFVFTLLLSGCTKKEESKVVEKLEDNIKYSLMPELTLTKKQPYIYLINAEENTVYQQFNVYNDDTLLWSSLLVEPGKGETLNVYKMLDEGEYSLKVVVSSYSLEDKSLISSGVNLTQDIKIEKGEQ